MALGLALLLSNLLLRWPPLGALVYPIADRFAKLRSQWPMLSIALALALTALIWWLEDPWRLALASALMLLLFSGRPLRRDDAPDIPRQAERLGRSIRRYFVPLPFIALFGVWGILLLWWLRFSAFPGRSGINRVVNLRLAQLAGLHFSLVKQSRETLQWALSSSSRSVASLYAWCVQFLARTQGESTFDQHWQTFVMLRWQWLAAAFLVRWWLG